MLHTLASTQTTRELNDIKFKLGQLGYTKTDVGTYVDDKGVLVMTAKCPRMLWYVEVTIKVAKQLGLLLAKDL